MCPLSAPRTTDHTALAQRDQSTPDGSGAMARALSMERLRRGARAACRAESSADGCAAVGAKDLCRAALLRAAVLRAALLPAHLSTDLARIGQQLFVLVRIHPAQELAGSHHRP